MKQLRITLIIIMFLLSPIKVLQGMELKAKSQKIIPLLVPDSDVLVPVNIQNDKGLIVYSSRWSPTQLHYFLTLDQQYSFNSDSDPTSDPIIIPQSSIRNLETFRLIERASSLLEINHTQQDEHKKNELKKYFAQTVNPKELNVLLRISDFLNNQYIYDACKENAVEIIQKFVQQQQISAALSFLEQFNNQHDAIYLGNHLMACSPSITQLLVRLQKRYAIKKATQDKRPWHCIPKQEVLFFRSPDNKNTLKFWHNKTLKTIHCNNHHYLKTALVCPTANKVFCVFHAVLDGTNTYNINIEIYDLNTSRLLHSKKIDSDPSLMRYSPQKNMLMLIKNNSIENYSLKTNNQLSKESTFNKAGMSNFAFNEQDGTMFYTINNQDIYHYDPENNSAMPIFSLPKKSKQQLQGLCASHDGKTLYFSSHSARSRKHKAIDKLCFYSRNENRIYKKITLHNQLKKISISPDGTILALEPFRQNRVLLLDAQSGQRIITLKSCHFPLSFSQDSTQLVACHKQGYIEYSLIHEKLRKELRQFPIEHITLLLSYANKLNTVIPHYADLSAQTKALFSELPAPIRKFFNGNKKTPIQ